MARADRRDAATRDPRIPPRMLNFNQRLTPDSAQYVRDFVSDSLYRELPFFQKLGLKPASWVLDYGCGLGRTAFALSEYLSSQGAYFGFDIAPEAIEFLKRGYSAYSNFHFEHLALELEHYQHNWRPGEKTVNRGGQSADSVKLDIAPGSIDFQITTSVFTHLLRHDIEATLRELGRVSSGVCYNTWFLVDDAVLTSLAAGLGDRQLPHEHEGMFYIDPQNVLMCTAYQVETMREIYAIAGHEITDVLRGSWSGAYPDNGVIYQDIVISRPL